MKRAFAIIFFFSVIGIVSCRNKKGNDVLSPDSIYFDYKISGHEGDDKLTVLLQYKEGDEEGQTVTIDEPGKVMLDGEILTADSAAITGSFYETNKVIDSFAGKHLIVFTNLNKKEYKEEFNFQPVSLVTTIPDTIHRGELAFELAGLEPENMVRVVLTDTMWINDGINRIDTVRDGRIIISVEDLKKFSNGPIQLELIREYERPIKSGTKAGGRLSISYSLKREFLLAD